MHWLDISFFVASIVGLVIAFGSAFMIMVEPRRISAPLFVSTCVGSCVMAACSVWMIVRKPVTLYFFGVELP